MSSPLNDLDQRQVRIEKLNRIKAAGYKPYAEKYIRTHYLSTASQLPIGT